MINNTNEILAQNLQKSERILMEFITDLTNLDKQDELNINSTEKKLGKMISEFISMGLEMSGIILSSIEVKEADKYCSCGKKLIIAKRGAQTKILSMYGHIPVERDTLFCRHCRKGYGVSDKQLEIYGDHRLTKGMTETITYVSQLMPFKEASETIKKLLNLDISAPQLQIVSEEVGKQVFQNDLLKANNAYNKPEEAAQQELSLYRKEGRLYILVDGSQVNTRIKDNNGSTWKEMKLGLIFSDRDMVKTGSDSMIITKKEYIPYLGSVSEFKKFVFAAAAKAGYGKLKEVVVIGDGAQWIWNMCEELFPDAVRILDFYHFSENAHNYAKALYPENEVARKSWVNKLISLVNDGKVEKAVEFVEKHNVSKLPDGIVNLSNYIVNNRERINYKYLKDNSYYIGSGAIESGNKTVIQHRMKQSGMRWGIKGGQYIASLRGKYKSNLWNEVIDAIYAS